MIMAAVLPLRPEPVKAATQPQVSFVGSVTTSPSSSNRRNFSFSHTVPAGNQRLLVVIFHMEGTRVLNSVTYAGVALTRAIQSDSGKNSRCQIQIWYLVAPATGANNVTVSYSANQDWDGITCLNYVGVNQTSPVGATAGRTLTSSSTTQSVSITTTVANSMVVGGVVTPGGTGDPMTALANNTERADFATGTGGAGSDGACWAGEANRASTGAFTFGATASASLRGTIAAIELKAAAEDIANAGTYSFGNVDEGFTYSAPVTTWTITNNSGYAVNITIYGTDLTGGTTPWTLSNDGSAGTDIYGLKAGTVTDTYSVVVKREGSTPYNTLATVSAGATQSWGLQLLVPTTISDFTVKSGTVTLVAAAV